MAAPCPPLPGFQPLSDRQLTRSPVNFREGRRSSDGLVAQGLVAFHQRLYSKDMSPGPLQLDQVTSAFDQERALVGAFSVVVKPSRRFVASSMPNYSALRATRVQ